MPLDEFKTQVLLLHSDQSTLDSLGSRFSDRYTVHYATSGSQALNSLAEAPINVIISAHDLPGMSGLEALREAKKRSPETIGILLTGEDGEEVEALVGDKEVFQVVHGSVDEGALLELVESATRGLRLTSLSESANDTAADADEEAEHIVMETADNGTSIISQSSVRLRAINPRSVTSGASVEVLVLATDDEFLKTIESSAGSVRKVHTTRTLAEADEILRSHEVGVAVIDAAIVRSKLERLTQYLRRHAPRLVPIVAGRRDDGEMLMDMINRGKVYRFLLKPVSPGRARLAVEASVKHHLDAPDSAFATESASQPAEPEALQPEETPGDVDPEPSATAPNTTEPTESADTVDVDPAKPEPAVEAVAANDGTLRETGSYRPAEMVNAAAAAISERSGGKMLGLAAAAAVAVIATLLWFGLSSDDDLPVPATPETAPIAAEADVVSPKSESIDTVDEALQIAESALLESRLPVAAEALRQVADADPDNARLPFLTAQLTQAQLRTNLTDARSAIREGRFEDAADALSAALALDVQDTAELDALTAELDSARSNQQTDDVLALASASMEAGDLVAPANNNARYFYELVLANDPENIAARQGLDIIAGRLVLQARGEIDNGNFDLAQELLYDVREIDSTNAEMIATADTLKEARAAARKAAADKAAAEKAAAERAAAARAAAAKAAAEKAAAEKAAAEKAAAEKAAAEEAAAEQVVADEAVGGSESLEDNAAETASQDLAAAEAPADVAPASLSSLVRTKYVAPKFPRSAVRRDKSGWVDLAFTVSADGTVKDIEINSSEPGDLFVPAATRAVEQWEFEPVVENGVAIEKRAAVRMMFSLD